MERILTLTGTPPSVISIKMALGKANSWSRESRCANTASARANTATPGLPADEPVFASNGRPQAVRQSTINAPRT
jgi:hypothetical protein